MKKTIAAVAFVLVLSMLAGCPKSQCETGTFRVVHTKTSGTHYFTCHNNEWIEEPPPPIPTPSSPRHP
jgi:hypothetical protein